MKKIIFTVFCAVTFIACQEEKPVIEVTEVEDKMDMKAILEGVERTREGFTNAINQGRFEDIENFTHPDLYVVGPGSADWVKMRELAAEKGTFGYDSIIMSPIETIVMSDSIAYDMGTSKVFYTDEQGNVISLKDTYIALLKKGNDGEWKLWRELATSTVLDTLDQ
ncbi:DUF4440 domain-containing protein [Robertkochia aurantiaca]|uniref:DUF4440 domain-containing protein n=1 Tax=Robertkochia aurantiaca TaxID=2873700 RepID=UPI001CCD363A|nr:DUF4440 domain-containing protein [Robertkochia sp. 3YJGBD-33]